MFSSTGSKLIIITGVSKGIGKAIAQVCIEKGANVFGIARSSSILEELAKEWGSKFKFLAGDITQQETVNLVSVAINEISFSSLTIINNAGTIEPIERFESINFSKLKEAFDVNFYSALSLTQACLPHLLKNDGKVINISSGAADNAYEGWLAYCCTKSAINMFTSCLAKEHPQLSAIAIRPGVVNTEMQDVIRSGGEQHMGEGYSKFIELYENKQLLDPSVPGIVIASLAIDGIPKDLNGSFISWDDSSLQKYQSKQ